MSNTLQIKRGTAASIPTLAAGEPGFATDTFNLYVGTAASGNKLIGGDLAIRLPAAGALVAGYVPYCTTAPNVIDDSPIFTDGTNVGIGSTGLLTVGTSADVYHVNIGGNGMQRLALVSNDNDASGCGIFLHTMNGATQTGNATLLVDNTGNFRIYVGTTGEAQALNIGPTGGVHVGGTSDPGDNNLLVDGTGEFTGQLNFGTAHGTTLLIDHIGEHTASHGIVFDSPLIGLNKVGVVNYDTATADGDVAVTGVGFKPTSVLIFAHVASTMQFSIGQGDASTNLCAIDFGSVSAGTWNYSATKVITLMQTGAIYCEASLKSLDADGFTLAFVKTGAKTGTARIYYTAFR